MAFTLSIVHGGTTVALAAGDYNLIGYAPQTGRGGVAVERIRLQVKNATLANIQADIQAIEKAIKAAEYRYDKGIGDKAWLKFLPDGLSTTYRSEIIRPKSGVAAGSVRLDDTTIRDTLDK